MHAMMPTSAWAVPVVMDLHFIIFFNCEESCGPRRVPFFSFALLAPQGCENPSLNIYAYSKVERKLQKTAT